MPCPCPSEHVQLEGGGTHGSPQAGWTAGQAGTGAPSEQERWSLAPQAQVQAPYGAEHGGSLGLHAAPSTQLGAGQVGALIAKQRPVWESQQLFPPATGGQLA